MIKTKWLFTLVAAALFALSASAGAKEVAIDNAGFEDPVLTDGNWGYEHPDWGMINGESVGTWNPDATGAIFYGYGGNAPEGQNVAWAEGDASGDVGLAQILTDTLTADTTYMLTVEVGNSYYYEWAGYKVQLLAGGTGTAPGEITGGNLLAEDDSSLTPADDTFATSTVTHTSGGVTDPNVGLPLQIRLLAKPGTGELDVDDVKLFIDGELAGEYVYDPAPVTVSLTLAVNDENNPTPVTDTMEIDVYDNACLAAIGKGLDPIGPADFDANCITDLKDFAVLAAKWLVDYTLTAPVPKP